MIPNPWTELPDAAPYVLKSDATLIAGANQSASRKKIVTLQIHTDVLPEPYIGAVHSAPIVLLNLNPSFGENDYIYYARPEAYKASRGNLLHEPAEYPFIFLNPRLADATNPAGPEWWSRRLRQLVATCGVHDVANGLACIEQFPYHSRNFQPLKNTLPSQQYTFQLVRQAMQRSAVIVMMRAKRFWLKAVPELAQYPFIETKSVRNATLSPNNLPAGVFDQIVARLGAQK